MLQKTTENEHASVLREFLYFLRPHKLTFGLVLFLSILLSCLNMSVPYALKLAVDTITAREHFHRLLLIAGGVLAVYGIKNVCYYVTKSRIVALAEHVAFDLRVELMTHLHRLSVTYYQQNKPGQISSRIIQDVESIKEFLSSEFIKLFLNALMIVVGITIIIVINPVLAGAALVLLPLDVVIYRIFRGAITESARAAKGEVANVSGDLVEQFSGVETLKSAASEKKEQEKFAFSMQRGMNAKLKERGFYLWQKVSADMVAGLSLMVLFIAGGFMVFNDRLTTAEFVAFYAYIGLLYPEVIKLVSDMGKFSSAKASFDRVYEILHTTPDVEEKPGARPHRIRKGAIEMENVSFSYGTGNGVHSTTDPESDPDGASSGELLFSDLNITIEAGQHVLISGPSGCGKSTLLNLLPRFYDPLSGRILIDGIDNQDYTLAALRAQIGFVFQQSFLFNISVLENIRYARPDADISQVKSAAELANAEDFIQKLPQQYMTTIGEGGVQLSYGERQRIGLARALLKNPRIMILDEAMGALDPDSRRAVIGNIMEVAQERTMLIVTHYPSSFPEMDKKIHLGGDDFS